MITMPWKWLGTSGVAGVGLGAADGHTGRQGQDRAGDFEPRGEGRFQERCFLSCIRYRENRLQPAAFGEDRGAAFIAASRVRSPL
jgi:hypothetical protein